MPVQTYSKKQLFSSKKKILPFGGIYFSTHFTLVALLISVMNLYDGLSFLVCTYACVHMYNPICIYAYAVISSYLSIFLDIF